MKTIQRVISKNGREYAYEKNRETKAVHKLSTIEFEKILLVGKIWATAVPNWGVPGKRVRGVVNIENCLVAKECPDGLTEDQFLIFKESPIQWRAFFRFREKANNNPNACVRAWQSTIQKIDEYIQKYQHLIPEPQQDAPSDATEPDLTNISN
jgi:hypothetical protein